MHPCWLLGWLCGILASICPSVSLFLLICQSVWNSLGQTALQSDSLFSIICSRTQYSGTVHISPIFTVCNQCYVQYVNPSHWPSFSCLLTALCSLPLFAAICLSPGTHPSFMSVSPKPGLHYSLWKLTLFQWCGVTHSHTHTHAQLHSNYNSFLVEGTRAKCEMRTVTLWPSGWYRLLLLAKLQDITNYKTFRQWGTRTIINSYRKLTT